MRHNYNYCIFVSLLVLHLLASMEVSTFEISNSPQNTTKFVNETVVFPCELGEILTDQSLQLLETRANHSNVIWYRQFPYLGYLPVHDFESLKSRVETPPDGSLIINELHKDDTGFYECRSYNGIGERLSAGAYLNVEFPATVVYAPPVQYQPEGRSGLITCEVHSNPALEFVRWRKDNELLEPCKMEGLDSVKHGQQLVIDRVNKSHEGNYSCTPYNTHGTHGASSIQVIVLDPPKFLVTPEPVYEGKLGSSLEIPCTATSSSNTYWRKGNGYALPRTRAQATNGTLLFGDLQEEDYGDYECIADTGVDQVTASTKVIVEGITPRPPYNLTATLIATMSNAVTLTWEQAMAAGVDARQSFLVGYKELGATTEWEEISVLPPAELKQFTVHDLLPGSTYEFQVAGINGLGKGEPSETISVTTRGPPKPYAPQNVTIVDQSDSFAISIHWEIQLPANQVADKINYYQVQYRLDDPQSEGWKNLNRENIRPPQTTYTYLIRLLRENTKYLFRAVAIPWTGSSAASEPVGHKLLPRELQRISGSDCANKPA